MSLRTVLPALWLAFAPPPEPAPAPAPAPGAPAAPLGAPAAPPGPSAPEPGSPTPAPGAPLQPAEPLPDPGAPAEPAPGGAEPPPIAAAPAPSANADAPITVTTRLSPDPSNIGDVLTLEVIVAYPRGYSINLPSSLDFSPLRRVEGDIVRGEVESTGNDLRQRFTIELQYFDVGEAEVPSFPVTYVDPNAEVHTYLVDPHPFVVDRLLGNESDPQPRGEDPMISLEYPNLRLATIIWSVLGGVAAAGLLAGLFVWWRRRERPLVLPPPIPAHVVAFEELDELAKQREELIAAGEYQEYYLRLTDIAKRYLGGRFGFEASDRTTEEIQDLLRGRVSITPLDPKQVLEFLQDCDLVKFARLSPPEEEAREALDVVRDMVERSKALPGQEQGPELAGGESGQDGVAAEPPAAEPPAAERTTAERPAPLAADIEQPAPELQTEPEPAREEAQP